MLLKSMCELSTKVFAGHRRLGKSGCNNRIKNNDNKYCSEIYLICRSLCKYNCLLFENYFLFLLKSIEFSNYNLK